MIEIKSVQKQLGLVTVGLCCIVLNVNQRKGRESMI